MNLLKNERKKNLNKGTLVKATFWQEKNKTEPRLLTRREHQEVEEEAKCKMARLLAFMSMLSIVILRKCIHIYHEYAYLLTDMAFVLVSSVRFSGMNFRHTAVVAGRISPMTSMMGRPDR